MTNVSVCFIYKKNYNCHLFYSILPILNINRKHNSVKYQHAILSNIKPAYIITFLDCAYMILTKCFI